jgi:hypothetical protein
MGNILQSTYALYRLKKTGDYFKEVKPLIHSATKNKRFDRKATCHKMAIKTVKNTPQSLAVDNITKQKRTVHIRTKMSG